MTAPMPETTSPREKAPFMPTVDLTDDMLFEVAPGEIITWGEIQQRLATPASSGDHAELARLAEAAERHWRAVDIAIGGNPIAADPVGLFVGAMSPALALALIAEVAALRAENADLREYRITSDLLVSALKADLGDAERGWDEAVGHVARLADWIEHEVDAELPYVEGEDDARTFLSKEAERG